MACSIVDHINEALRHYKSARCVLNISFSILQFEKGPRRPMSDTILKLDHTTLLLKSWVFILILDSGESRWNDQAARRRYSQSVSICMQESVHLFNGNCYANEYVPHLQGYQTSDSDQ